MNRPEYPILAKEGRVHLVLVSVAAVAATWLWGWGSVPVWLLAAFVFQFFRDPARSITTDKGAVVCPASGKVVSLGEEHNPYADDVRMIKVSIFMNVFSVHSNLAPVAGTIVKTAYHAGRFLNAAMDKASMENERNAIWIRTDDGQDVHSIQIAGLIARRIFSYVKEGDRVETGQRYGFIRFGSRVDIYLPLESRIEVKLGQWVSSGTNILAYLPEK